MALDSTMNFEITGPGGGSGAPSTKPDSTQREVFSTPSPNDGGGGRGRNRVPSVSKPESNDKISSVFYDPLTGNPGTLESTMNDVLEISFGK
jgi:hypothetical protein